MASVTSNRAEVVRGLYRLRDKLTFVGPGRYRRMLGLDAVDLIAESIIEQTVLNQADPQGNALAPLSPPYLARKVKQGYSDLILVRTGQMLSIQNLRGQYVVKANLVEMEYGGDEPSKLKAEWAQEGNRKQNRPKRKFYAMNRQTVVDLDRLIRESFDRSVNDAANHGP